MKTCRNTLVMLAIAGSTTAAFGRVIPPPPIDTFQHDGNGSFDRRMVMPFGTSVFSSDLMTPVDFAPGDYDYIISDALTPGAADSFFPVAGGLEVRRPFTAWIDNTTGATQPDTLMRSVTETFSEIWRNDNSSPIGNGLASLVPGYVNANGEVDVQVTGAGDDSFNGNHAQSGDYNLYVRMESLYDIDFLSFRDLVPGSNFTAEITQGDFNSVLGWVGDTGQILFVDDNGGTGTLSLINGIVPASGEVNIVVTGWADYQLFGFHEQSGDYRLDFTATTIPSASNVALFSLAGIFSARRRRD